MTTQLLDTTLELRDRLARMGVPLPFELKRRDPKEPGRRQKEATEDALYRTFLAHFRKQKAYIRETITRLDPERKAILGNDTDFYMSQFDDMWGADDFIAKIARLLVSATAAGIDIFQELVPLEIDYTLVNEAAAKWAWKYSGDLVKLIEDKTKNDLRAAVSSFIRTPGMTIGDIMQVLSPTYSENRALMIAVTETTNAYAEAEKLAGEELQKEYPDVLVIKRWYTNNDSYIDKHGRRRGVCEICEPFHNKVVPLNEPFVHPTTGQEYDRPPIHPRCRCWISTTTRISGVIDEEEKP